MRDLLSAASSYSLYAYNTWTHAYNQSLSPTIPINDSLSVLWIGCVFTSVDGYYEFRCECIDLFMTIYSDVPCLTTDPMTIDDAYGLGCTDDYLEFGS